MYLQQNRHKTNSINPNSDFHLIGNDPFTSIQLLLKIISQFAKSVNIEFLKLITIYAFISVSE